MYLCKNFRFFRFVIMKKFLSIAISGLVCAGPAVAAPPCRIAVEPEPAVIYATGALSGNAGVYRLGTVTNSVDKLSGTTYVQYYFGGSGGTFTDASTVYGTCSTSYRVYGGKATAEGGADGAWSHTVWVYSDAAGQPLTDDVVAFDMACDPASGLIYGWFKSAAGSYRLGTYDGEQRTVSQIGENSKTIINALACDGNGVLWGIEGSTGKLYTINKTTGTLTEKASVGVTAMGTNQSAAIYDAAGKMYWGAVRDIYNASLYEIDLVTGEATHLYNFPMGQRFNAFYIDNASANKNAPAAPLNLKARFTGEATTVSFTAPSATVGGDALDGELTYIVEVDGERAATGKVKAGNDAEVSLNIAVGNHQIAAGVANAAGDSPKALIDVLIGYDAPGTVRNLKVAADGNDVTISWDVPDGKNGGTVNLAETTYSVVRQPGAVTVASGITGCSVVDHLPDAPMTNYYWEVSVLTKGYDGMTAVSGKMLLGEPYKVPYTQDFEQAVDFEDICFKTVNADPVTPEWQIARGDDGNSYAEIRGAYSVRHADHLLSAPISFEAGVTYSLKFKIACAAAHQTTQLRIYLAAEQNPDKAISPYIAPNLGYMANRETEGLFALQSYEFTVPESGVYSIGFYDFAISTNTEPVMIDDIEITDTRSAITDITAEGESNDVTVYDLAGRPVARALDSSLPAGVYIVKTSNKTFKINI